MAKKSSFSNGNKPKVAQTSRTVSDAVVYSCYLASAAILVIAGIEAVKQFKLGNLWGGVVYVILAVVGVLFSVFITYWNRRNKEQLSDKKN